MPPFYPRDPCDILTNSGMSAFQIIGLSLLGLLVALSVMTVITRPGRALASLVWIAVWVLAAIAITFPESTTAVAHRVGIQRGADLVAYCGILAGMVGFF